MSSLRPALAVPFLAALAACGGHAPPPVPPGATEVGSIRIEGNDALETDLLREGLALERLRETGQEFDAYLVEIDRERLHGVYLRHGFFNAKVTAAAETKGETADVRFRIHEGRRAPLARVEMAGLPDDPEISTADLREEIREQIPIEDGAPFDYAAYERAKPYLVNVLQRHGYAHARLEATVAADVGRDQAIVRLEFRPGPRARFGRVALAGVRGDLGDAARARLAAREGETYSTTALVDSQDALYDMGRFASVRIDPDLGGGGTIVPVQIGVTQGPRHEVRLGGGFGISPSAYEVRGRSSYRVAGWPTSLTSTFLEFRPAYVWLRDDDSAQPRIEARAVLERMDLFRPFLMAEAEVAFSYLAVEAYTSVGPRVRLGLRSPLWRRIVGASVAWQYELLGFSRIDEALDDATADALGIDGPYHLGYYAQSLYVDLRDDPVAPRLGLYAEARVEEGTVAAGGEFGYLRWTPELRGYAPLGPIVLAARGRLGDFVDDVPVTQRYFAGGASSQRGFAERTLAPTATREVDGETFSAPIGGGAMLETGAELRFPIATIKDIPLGGVVFADGADVTEELDDLDPGHLHWAAGAGLRAATPIGPVRIDLGWRLNRTGDGEPRAGERFAFHLSLGEAF